MQLSLFEEIDIRQEGVEFVAKRIMQSDSIRGYIKQAIKHNDKSKLTKLFNESIRTFGFAGLGCWSWGFGNLKTPDGKQKFKITARELADMALKITK